MCSQFNFKFNQFRFKHSASLYQNLNQNTCTTKAVLFSILTFLKQTQSSTTAAFSHVTQRFNKSTSNARQNRMIRRKEETRKTRFPFSFTFSNVFGLNDRFHRGFVSVAGLACAALEVSVFMVHYAYRPLSRH